MFDLEHSVQFLGYPAVALGAFLEGESVMVAAGIAANLGYLRIGPIMAIAAVFSFLGDQAVFWLGRRYGMRIVGRWPRLVPGLARVRALIERHPHSIVIGVRFMYGLRTPGLLALGMTPSLEGRRFALLNAFGACLWGVAIAGAGYVFGEAIHWLLVDLRDDLHDYRALLIALVIASAAALKVFLMRRPPERIGSIASRLEDRLEGRRRVRRP